MDDRFESLQELIDAIEIGLDIECSINNEPYYIGWSKGKRVIALCPNGEGVHFDTLEDMLSYKINGNVLKNIWTDIQIRSM